MFRAVCRCFESIALILLLGLATVTQPAHASSFGFSFNLNFGGQEPVDGNAGKFGDSVWNNFREPDGRPQPFEIDIYGDQTKSPATVSWQSNGIGAAKNVQGSPGNVAMMQGYLDSPKMIQLNDLDQILSVPRGTPLNYTLILYTYGGQEGAEGGYIVNGNERDRREHVDTAEFTGEFLTGKNGNVQIFPNLRDPDLLIESFGFGPVNALSLVYCLPGDFNADGQVDVTDLEELNEVVKEGSNDRKFDVNFDLNVDFNDVMSWIKCSKGTCIGDVNLDGTFDSGDLVELFTEGIYETDGSATWTSGDWNGDCKFDSSDLLVAFQEGCYDSGAEFGHRFAAADGSSTRSSAPGVPEPSTAALALLACGCLGRVSRHRRRRCAAT